MSLMQTRGAVRFIGLMAALAVGAPGIADAAVYKWTDARGVVHYDDQNAIHGQQLTREYVQSMKVKPVADWVGVVPTEFARDVESRCTTARERVQTYGGASQIYERDSRGVTQPLSPSQGQQLVGEANRDVARYCAPNSARLLYQQRGKTAGR